MLSHVICSIYVHVGVEGGVGVCVWVCVCGWVCGCGCEWVWVGVGVCVGACVWDVCGWVWVGGMCVGGCVGVSGCGCEWVWVGGCALCTVCYSVLVKCVYNRHTVWPTHVCDSGVKSYIQ